MATVHDTGGQLPGDTLKAFKQPYNIVDRELKAGFVGIYAARIIISAMGDQSSILFTQTDNGFYITVIIDVKGEKTRHGIPQSHCMSV